MSNVCICVADKGASDKLKRFKKCLHQCGLFTFDELNFAAPFLQGTDYDKKLICSISDSEINDNCEMFLLPDNCTFNGRPNSTPFAERTQILLSAFEDVIDRDTSLELFVGYCGTPYSDFEHQHITLREFADCYATLNNAVNPPDLHLFISDTEG